VLSDKVSDTLIDVCMRLQETSDMKFIEIGTDINHVHFLIQATPSYSISQYVRMLKANTGKNIFKYNTEVKDKLYGGEFWSDGYWITTVSKYATEDVIKEYVKDQGKDKYDLLYKRDTHFDD
jgi:REP element-mobilizing transposase RayT